MAAVSRQTSEVHAIEVRFNAAPMPSASSGPKRLRGTYTSKACIQCRRRKLKCSGSNPCQRCAHQGIQCSLSYDGPNGDVSRNQEHSANGVSLTPPSVGVQDDIVRMGTSSTTEARIERIEAMMETLIGLRSGASLRASIEPEQAVGDPKENQVVLCSSVPQFPSLIYSNIGDSTPIEAFNAQLAAVKDQLGLSNQANAHSSSPASSARTGSISIPSSATSSIRVGSRSFPFPNRSDYEKYIDFFFADMNQCISCINEMDFRMRSQMLQSSDSIEHGKTSFLALNFIIFACADMLVDMAPPEKLPRPPGWRWFLAANDLVGKRKVGGQADLHLIQFLVYESYYLLHVDRPNAAYNAIGLACRLCFQFGLHQQSSWNSDSRPYSVHMRQRVFWTVYFLDRRISLCCGRPYGMRDLDIEVDQPAWIEDKALHPNQPLPPVNLDRSSNMYLSCMIVFAKFAGEVWDQVFSANATKLGPKEETLFILDARIRHWSDTILPTIPILPVNGSPTKIHLRQKTLISTRISYLRLLLRRRKMVSLTYDNSTGQLCGELAISIVQEIKMHSAEAQLPSSYRTHMSAALGGAIFFLATLLVRSLSILGLQAKHHVYAENFNEGVAILRDISINMQAARRILDDLGNIIHVVTSILSQPVVMPQEDLLNFVPANIADLFANGSVDLIQQADWIDGDGDTSGAGNGIPSYDALGSLDSWSYDMQPTINGYEVPWI